MWIRSDLPSFSVRDIYIRMYVSLPPPKEWPSVLSAHLQDERDTWRSLIAQVVEEAPGLAGFSGIFGTCSLGKPYDFFVLHFY